MRMLGSQSIIYVSRCANNPKRKWDVFRALWGSVGLFSNAYENVHVPKTPQFCSLSNTSNRM